MARTHTVGLNYFSLDTNISDDDKIQLIEAEFGLKGFAIVIKMFAKIYSDKGYYYNWTESEKLLFAKKLGSPSSLVDEVIIRSVKRGIFNESIFNEFKILTSASIQRRYLDGCVRRKNIDLIQEYLLIDTENYINRINVNINSINVNINSLNVNAGTQSKVKESKVKESSSENDFNFYDEKENFILSLSQKIELVAMQNKISISVVKEKVKEFIIHCKLESINWVNDDEAFKHFKNWIPKNLERKQSVSKGNGKQILTMF